MDQERENNPGLFRTRRYIVLIGLLLCVAVACSLLRARREDPIDLVTCVAVSPSGDKVAFLACRSYEGGPFLDWLTDNFGFPTTDRIDIHLLITSLKDQTTLDTEVQCSLGIGNLSWSPDESQLAYVPFEVDGIGRVNAFSVTKGSVCTVATGDDWHVVSPHFSPDGNYLGFVHNYSRNTLTIRSRLSGQEQRIGSPSNYWHWCWHPNDLIVYYIKDRKSIVQYTLSDASESTLVSLDPNEGEFPGHLICSPDGSLLGFHSSDGWFRTVDLQTHEVRKRFECDHYFLDFDWSDLGICYLDTTEDGERHKRAKLMVFNPGNDQSTLIAEGSFADPRWMHGSMILVRQDNSELWAYDVETRKARVVFTEDLLVH